MAFSGEGTKRSNRQIFIPGIGQRPFSLPHHKNILTDVGGSGRKQERLRDARTKVTASHDSTAPLPRIVIHSKGVGSVGVIRKGRSQTPVLVYFTQANQQRNARTSKRCTGYPCLCAPLFCCSLTRRTITLAELWNPRPCVYLSCRALRRRQPCTVTLAC